MITCVGAGKAENTTIGAAASSGGPGAEASDPFAASCRGGGGTRSVSTDHEVVCRPVPVSREGSCTDADVNVVDATGAVGMAEARD